jgi:hypothetical protein
MVGAAISTTVVSTMSMNAASSITTSPRHRRRSRAVAALPESVTTASARLGQMAYSPPQIRRMRARRSLLAASWQGDQ